MDNLVIQNVPKIEKLAIISIGKKLIDILENICVKNYDSEKLEAKLDQFKTYLVELPSVLHTKLFEGIIQAICEHYVTTKSLSIHETEKILSRLMEVITFLNVNCLYEKDIPKNVFPFLYPYLHNMSNITVLVFNDESLCKFILSEETTLKAVQNMKNLHIFVMYFICSDRIIKALSENCKDLEHLDVVASGNVSDESIKYIINFNKLKIVYLSDTFITIHGYTKLLLQRRDFDEFFLPTIINKVLVNIHNTNLDDTIKFSCTTISISVDTIEDVEIMSKMCPNVKKMWIKCNDNFKGNFDSFTTLTNLADFGCTSINYRDMRAMLKAVGQNLKSLHFVCATDLNLLEINDLCPKLNTLTLHGCTFSDESDKDYSTNLRNYFTDVTEITCSDGNPEDKVMFLLTNCKNLSVLKLSDNGEILRMEKVSEILNANKLEKLTTLILGANFKMCKESLNLIVENCQNLHTLSGLQFCQQLSNEEREEFILAHPKLNYGDTKSNIFSLLKFLFPDNKF